MEEEVRKIKKEADDILTGKQEIEKEFNILKQQYRELHAKVFQKNKNRMKNLWNNTIKLIWKTKIGKQ